MNNKIIDVKGKYQEEINNISNLLNELENGRIYEFTGASMDGRLQTKIGKLRGLLDNLINKIEYGKDSERDLIAECFSNKDKKI